MSLIYWDTMLFIYWIEDIDPFTAKVRTIYERMMERGDHLCTSVFTLGELLVLPERTNNRVLAKELTGLLTGSRVRLLEWSREVAVPYASIRARTNVKAPDAIHLACAAKAGVDLFLTNDKQLRRLAIPGISFIDGLETTVLGVN